MGTMRERILEYLAERPEGATDAEVTRDLDLKNHAEANMCCHGLERDGLIERRKSAGPIRNLLRGSVPIGTGSAALPVLDTVGTASNAVLLGGRSWYWEGNVQAAVVAYLVAQGRRVMRVASTQTREHGRDIEAMSGTTPFWVTVKGWPDGTDRTQASTQAGIWFQGALFDIVEWRGEDDQVLLAMALPDFPRYRALAARTAWLRPVARYANLWVREGGFVEEET